MAQIAISTELYQMKVSYDAGGYMYDFTHRAHATPIDIYPEHIKV